MAIVGIGFPFTKGPRGFPEPKTDDEIVADNIRRILVTPVGSRPMRPTVGSNVYRFVFESIDPALKSHIEYEVRRAIQDGEPRVRVLDVRVLEAERPVSTSGTGGDTDVIVEVDYELRGLRATTRVSLST